MIIGGGQIYEQALKDTKKIYYTTVHENFDGDTFYPKLNSSDWKLISKETHRADEKNKYDFTFKVFERF